MTIQNRLIPAAVYLRVSSEMQVEIGSSLPSQLAAIEEYARKNGYQILPEHTYSDDGVSAKTADRPDFQRMISAAKKDNPPFQAILCYDNSRFARSREDAIVFKALLRRRGINLKFVKQDFEDSPMGRFMEGMIEIVDQWYSENLAIETKRGQQQNAKDGYSTGGRPPYGLRRVVTQNTFGANKARWEPDPETSLIVKRIYEMYIGGMGYKAIAYALNEESIPAPSGGLWLDNTLYYILHKNQPAYLGKQIYGREKARTSAIAGKFMPEESWIVKENAWEPIITVEMALAADAKRSKKTARKIRQAPEKKPFILTGKVYCGQCGAALTGSTGTGKRKSYDYYRCNKNKSSGPAACKLRNVPQQRLEDAVIEAIRRYLSDETYLKSVYDDHRRRALEMSEQEKKRIEDIDAAIARKEEERKRLVASIAKGVLTNEDAKSYLSQLRIDTESLQSQKDMLGAVTLDSFGIGMNDFEDFAFSVQSILSLGSEMLRQQMINSWVDRITVRDGMADVIFTINPADVGISLDIPAHRECSSKMAERKGFEPLERV